MWHKDLKKRVIHSYEGRCVGERVRGPHERRGEVRDAQRLRLAPRAALLGIRHESVRCRE